MVGMWYVYIAFVLMHSFIEHTLRYNIFPMETYYFRYLYVALFLFMYAEIYQYILSREMKKGNGQSRSRLAKAFHILSIVILTLSLLFPAGVYSGLFFIYESDLVIRY